MSTPHKKLGLATLVFLHYGWGWIEGHSFFLSLCPSINKKKKSINQSIKTIHFPLLSWLCPRLRYSNSSSYVVVFIAVRHK